MKWSQPVHLLETCGGNHWGLLEHHQWPVTSVPSLSLASNFPPCLLFLPVCLCVCDNTRTVCLWHVINVPRLMSLKLGIAYQLTHPAMSYIWRGGALESHQNLCHKNLTSSLNGYIESFILSRAKSKFSESSPFTSPPPPPSPSKQVWAILLKTVLWLASWITGQSLSREPKIFHVKDDAKMKEKQFFLSAWPVTGCMPNNSHAIHRSVP